MLGEKYLPFLSNSGGPPATMGNDVQESCGREMKLSPDLPLWAESAASECVP